MGFLEQTSCKHVTRSTQFRKLSNSSSIFDMMTDSGLIAFLMDCLSSIVVNFCILYAPSTFTLLLCLMSGAVVHRRNLISAISCFSVSSFTRFSESGVRSPPWSLHSSKIFSLSGFFPFQLLFFSAGPVSLLLSQ